MKNYLLLIALLFNMISCGDPPSISSTLNIADSLMNYSSKLALDTLRTINNIKIKSPKNQAYHALLYTQAQHKNYITFTDDSLINVAVDYYKSSDNNSLYIKALMYKGAVLSDMGFHKEAMESYKTAEETADSTEYHTLALINSRIGELYQKSRIENNEDITRYKKSLYYFKQTNDSLNINNCYALIGQLYKYINRDSAYLYINKSIELTKAYKDSAYLFKIYSQLAVIYLLTPDYNRSKELALYVINNNKQDVSNVTYHCASRSYACLNMPDSAIYYLNFVKTSVNHEDRANYYITLSEIEKSKGNYKAALKYKDIKNEIVDSILINTKKTDFYNIDKKYDNNRQIIKQQQLQMQKQIRDYMIIFFIFILIILIIIIYSVISRSNLARTDNHIMIERLQNEFTQTQNAINKVQRTELMLMKIIETHIKSKRYLIELAYRHSGNPGQFASKFREHVKISRLPDSVWHGLRYAVNEKNHGIIDFMTKKYPQLTDEDIDMICLICCEFSYLEIAVCFGYTNERSACNRRIIISRKLGIDISLEIYIKNQIITLSNKIDS